MGDRIDFDDMYWTVPSMDFASECGFFPNDDPKAKELMDKAIDTYAEIKFKKLDTQTDQAEMQHLTILPK